MRKVVWLGELAKHADERGRYGLRSRGSQGFRTHARKRNSGEVLAIYAAS